VEGAGHLPFKERPEEFVGVLLPFLASLRDDRARAGRLVASAGRGQAPEHPVDARALEVRSDG